MRAPLPNVQMIARGANDLPHSLRARVEIRMPQDPANKLSGLVMFDDQMNQTIVWVTEIGPREIAIVTEESGLRKLMQEWNDLLILHACHADVTPNVAHSDSPVQQEFALVIIDVFVKYVHRWRTGVYFTNFGQKSSCSANEKRW